MQQKIKSILQASIDVKQKIVSDPAMIAKLEEVTNIVTNAFANGNKVLFCGNGGSAADAQHLAAEFSGRFYTDRNPLPSDALHCNTSYLTAVANDYSFDVVYSRMVKGMGRQGDVLIGLSTSGNSVNIIKAMEQARELGMISVGLTGESGGKMKDICDHLLNAPSTDTPRIQESHITMGHIICELVEASLFNDKK
ncbi:phosphoheptose isomerase [Flavipsychrobacter stenotrophus]|uniref:Phosphoheptose isomerase n=1 Tax=Flavipsychrobacter stenotrophus TaxID=2077091 RepID=A0A2S7T0B2_9BACT|nr:D-sedoheptulose 7-phosphate isomerase [Flavipsychrobacter stenotrophus]PQJ12394.1 phosphoheptose isomerase [Flavipsychrobacter stenotrophus]